MLLHKETPEEPGAANAYARRTYVEGEISQKIQRQPIKLAPMREGKRFHLYCSPYCHGAEKVINELMNELALPLLATCDTGQMHECESMLVYLTSASWTSGEESDKFADDVRQAKEEGLRLICAHETLVGAQAEERHACTFESIMDCTPYDLMREEPNVYGAIAMNLAGGEYRMPGLLRLAQQVAKGGGKRRK